jgi:hypothetical protein
MNDLTLGYVIIYVPDVTELETGATALAFAEETFVASTCHGFEPNRMASKSAGAEVAFVTKDVPAAFRKALEGGAVSRGEPMTKPWGQIVSYVRDLNGFLVELCSPVGDGCVASTTARSFCSMHAGLTAGRCLATSRTNYEAICAAETSLKASSI